MHKGEEEQPSTLRSGRVRVVSSDTANKRKLRKGSKNKVMTSEDNSDKELELENVENEFGDPFVSLEGLMEQIASLKEQIAARLDGKEAEENDKDSYLSLIQGLTAQVVDLKERLTNTSAKTTIPTYIFDPTVSMPSYDSAKMTPEAFIIEIEEHLAWKNVDKSMWLKLIARMFPKDSDIARWWRETKTSAVTWEQFKVVFAKYEESGQNKDKLLSKLFAKRQAHNDAFETFAWDINGIYRKINPKVNPSEVIERIINSALPELSVILRNHSFNSVAELIFKAREIINDLNNIRGSDAKPILRARATDPLPQKQTQSFDRYKHRYRAPWRNYNNGVSSSQKPKEPEPHSQADNSQGTDSSNASTSSANANKSRRPADNPRGPRETRACNYCKIVGHLAKD
jgi:hypothetical protein